MHFLNLDYKLMRRKTTGDKNIFSALNRFHTTPIDFWYLLWFEQKQPVDWMLKKKEFFFHLRTVLAIRLPGMPIWTRGAFVVEINWCWSSWSNLINLPDWSCTPHLRIQIVLHFEKIQIWIKKNANICSIRYAKWTLYTNFITYSNISI